MKDRVVFAMMTPLISLLLTLRGSARSRAALHLESSESYSSDCPNGIRPDSDTGERGAKQRGQKRPDREDKDQIRADRDQPRRQPQHACQQQEHECAEDAVMQGPIRRARYFAPRLAALRAAVMER